MYGWEAGVCVRLLCNFASLCRLHCYSGPCLVKGRWFFLWLSSRHETVLTVRLHSAWQSCLYRTAVVCRCSTGSPHITCLTFFACPSRKLGIVPTLVINAGEKENDCGHLIRSIIRYLTGMPTFCQSVLSVSERKDRITKSGLFYYFENAGTFILWVGISPEWHWWESNMKYISLNILCRLGLNISRRTCYSRTGLKGTFLKRICICYMELWTRNIK